MPKSKKLSQAVHDRTFDEGQLEALRKRYSLPTPDELVDQFLQHVAMKKVADYAMRGRRFSATELCELNRKWITAFDSIYGDEGLLVVRSNVGQRVPQKRPLADLDDAEAELFLRGLDPPIGPVQQRQQLMKRFREELIRSGPESSPVTKQQIGEFMEERNNPYH
jgi:hypothetical protein